MGLQAPRRQEPCHVHGYISSTMDNALVEVFNEYWGFIQGFKQIVS